MGRVMWRHPYRDIQTGDIVVPHKIQECDPYPMVLYYKTGETDKRYIELWRWNRSFEPIMFTTQEGA
jgi:hypothetical protein